MEKVYGELDYQRAIQVYLTHIPAMYGARRGIMEDLEGTADYPQGVGLWGDKLDSKTPLLTGNSEVIYPWAYVDLSKGPMVV